MATQAPGGAGQNPAYRPTHRRLSGRSGPAGSCLGRRWAGPREAKPFDLAGLYAARFEEHPPYLIYLRMLWERYGDELRQEAEAANLPRIHLTSFQRDGMWRAKRILAERHGVVIADEVGLGKSFLAGELIREAVEERRQRVLLIAPATRLRGFFPDPWLRTRSTFCR